MAKARGPEIAGINSSPGDDSDLRSRKLQRGLSGDGSDQRGVCIMRRGLARNKVIFWRLLGYALPSAKLYTSMMMDEFAGEL